MNCHDVRETLSSYLDGEADSSQRELWASHVRDCPGCAGELRWHQAIKGALGRLPSPALSPEALGDFLKTARLKEASLGEKALPSRGRRLRWVFGMAAAAAAGVLMYIPSSIDSEEEAIPLELMLKAHNRRAESPSRWSDSREVGSPR